MSLSGRSRADCRHQPSSSDPAADVDAEELAAITFQRVDPGAEPGVADEGLHRPDDRADLPAR